MLISPAYAQAAGGGSDFFVTLMPLVLIFVVFYFLLIRPQQKRMKDHKAMINAVRRGDTVVTGGGIVGKVAKVKDDETVQIENRRRHPHQRDPRYALKRAEQKRARGRPGRREAGRPRRRR